MPKKNNKQRPIVESLPKNISRKRKKTRKYSLWDIVTPPQKIKTLQDLIKYAYSMDFVNVDKTHINVNALIKIIPSLKKLDDLIGLKKVKKTILNIILYYIQNFNQPEDYLHTVIIGSPGVGKTTVAKILGEIYAGLGFLSTGDFHILQRTDLIGKYLGHTADKTKNVLEKCKGGVAFLDEAYSMAPEKSSNKDSYSKEAIDVINEFLSNNKNDFVFMVAGYKKELDSTFFASNQGLKRRFPWTIEIDPYSPKELHKIFCKFVHDKNWSIDDDAINTEFFKTNQEHFQFAGGDIETFFSKCKITHTNRMFFDTKSEKYLLTKKDIDKALKMHLKNRETVEKTPLPDFYT